MNDVLAQILVPTIAITMAVAAGVWAAYRAGYTKGRSAGRAAAFAYSAYSAQSERRLERELGINARVEVREIGPDELPVGIRDEMIRVLTAARDAATTTEQTPEGNR